MELIKSKAFISECGKHRYSLVRQWDESKPYVLFIGLNPSRADDVYNDATITRCINFAAKWGFGGMYFGNLYSFRTPYVTRKDADAQMMGEFPPLMENLAKAANELTDVYLMDMIKASDEVVCCWGSWKFTGARIGRVLSMIKKASCFGFNADGTPKHPLYQPNNSILVPFKI